MKWFPRTVSYRLKPAGECGLRFASARRRQVRLSPDVRGADDPWSARPHRRPRRPRPGVGRFPQPARIFRLGSAPTVSARDPPAFGQVTVRIARHPRCSLLRDARGRPARYRTHLLLTLSETRRAAEIRGCSHCGWNEVIVMPASPLFSMDSVVVGKSTRMREAFDFVRLCPLFGNPD